MVIPHFFFFPPHLPFLKCSPTPPRYNIYIPTLLLSVLSLNNTDFCSIFFSSPNTIVMRATAAAFRRLLSLVKSKTQG